MEHHIQFDQRGNELHLLDQRVLPAREECFICKNSDDIREALKTMVIRGAPAIGVTAAYGCYLASLEVQDDDPNWRKDLEQLLQKIVQSRPTAVNLAWAVGRMSDLWDTHSGYSLSELQNVWLSEAQTIHAEDIATNKKLGEYGAELLEDGYTVMTHCNAGALATAGWGTALGVVRSAVAQGKSIEVIANETRPFLQGARLTAYELAQDNIPVRVACDNAAALLFSKGLVHCVVVGADRIAANGDVANKIGTCSVAHLAKSYSIPFYVAAPLSTIDSATISGTEIPIEKRPSREVTHVINEQIVPDGVEVYNYAFDITPNKLVSGIITEAGVLTPPYVDTIARAKKQAKP